MTREDALKIAKPILFNTEMVRAILDGKKTATRRAVRYKYSNTEMKVHMDKYGTRLIEIQKNVEGETNGKNPDGSSWHKLLPYIEKNPPCKYNDILYVRETWARQGGEVYYRADYLPHTCTVWTPLDGHGWKPSIHMPKGAARIFLRVTDVRAERLQIITEEQAEKEGCFEYRTEGKFVVSPTLHFMEVWDSTIKKGNIGRYGWKANPWVWVIEFEVLEVE